MSTPRRGPIEHAEQLVPGAPPFGPVDREVAELDRHAGLSTDARSPRRRRLARRCRAARACVAYSAPCRASTSASATTSSKSPYALGTWVSPVLMPNAPCASDSSRSRSSGAARRSSGARSSTPIAATRRVPCPASGSDVQRESLCVAMRLRSRRGRSTTDGLERWHARGGRRAGRAATARSGRRRTSSCRRPRSSRPGGACSRRAPSTSSVRSECVWMSMKPGHDHRPACVDDVRCGRGEPRWSIVADRRRCGRSVIATCTGPSCRSRSRQTIALRMSEVDVVTSPVCRRPLRSDRTHYTM